MAPTLSSDQIRQQRPTPRRAAAWDRSATRSVDACGRTDTDAIMAVYDRHADHLYCASCLVGGPVIAGKVVEDVFTDLGRRPDRFDLDDGPLFDLLVTDAHRRAVDALIAAEHARFAERFGPVLADRTGSLPGEERDLVVLASTGRYTSSTLSALLRQPPSVLSGRILASLVHLSAQASSDEGGGGSQASRAEVLAGPGS